MGIEDVFEIGQYDTRPKWTNTLYNNYGQPDQVEANLTGATDLRFLMRSEGQTGTAPKIDDNTHLDAIGDPLSGVVQFDWQPDIHTDEPGMFDVQVKVTQADGGVITYPNQGQFFKVMVNDDLSD